ncbi:MAG: RT0821/Lpp0805 family surface protein [Hyphomicrobiaceae bacterium]
MRESSPLFAIAATFVVAVFMVAAILILPGFAIASEPAEPGQSATSEDKAPGTANPPAPPHATPPADDQATTCTCPETFDKSKIWPKPKFAELRRPLDQSDEIAALESVQLALAEVGDGSSYVWHRYHGQLSGVVTPTASFRDRDGNICRHVIVVLSAGTRSKRSEGVACRLSDGRWQLQG